MQLLQGNNLEVLKDIPDNSIDSCVTDPPYGLSFMNKKWDHDVPTVEFWTEVYRVLKPGAHVLSFGGTRTYHRMTCNIEDAGFEIRDQVMWLYGSGFPKSHNISKAIDKKFGAEREVVGDNPNNRPSKRHGAAGFDSELEIGSQRKAELKVTAPTTDAAKQWDGFGTALKPANEPICLARKPLSEKTIVDNVFKWGVGGINIDGCRVGKGEDRTPGGLNKNQNENDTGISGRLKVKQTYRPTGGRFPANIILDDVAGEMLDEQSGNCKSATNKKATKSGGIWGVGAIKQFENGAPYSGEQGGASRFFYCAKASKSERNAGLDSSFLVWESESWEKEDLNLLTENIGRLSKDISGDILTADKSWSTDIYGHSISEQYPKGTIYTIETIIKLITELRTLNVSQNLNIRDCIQDAIRMIEANGLSLVESVDFISTLNLNTIREETGSLLGAVSAVLPMLLKIKESARSENFHATVKPIKLMRYLTRLITPPNGTCLDPFMGSGTTGIACKQEGFDFIGMELSEEYFEIAEKRIDAVKLNT